MVVGQPPEQGLAFTSQFGIGRFRPVFQQCTRIEHTLPHLFPITNGCADIAEYPKNFLAQDFKLCRVCFPVNRETNIGLGDRPLRPGLVNAKELAFSIALYGNNRMNGDMDRQVMTIDRGGNGIDEEGHVLVNHLDKGVYRRVTLFFL